jgi:hypothetical protein
MRVDLRGSPEVMEPGEVDIISRPDSMGEAMMAVDDLEIGGGADESSLECSAEVARWRFLKRFQDDFRDLEGLGGVSGSVVSVSLRFFRSLVSFTSSRLSSSL